jgi:HD-GYP domain-containing protein (c-di-GMP phosphodiesterase class II)
MFKRLFSGGAQVVEPPDPLPLVDKLLKTPGAADRSQLVLRHLVSSLNGTVRGVVVRHTGGEAARVEAVEHLPSGLLGLTLEHGPWRDGRPRLVQNLVAELFTPNRQELRQQLGDAGLRDAKSALVAPVASDEVAYGALLLTKFDDAPFAEDDLRLARRWANILGEVQGTQTELLRARQSLTEFTRAFVEATEAQDFAQLGHATRVTAYALGIGRALGMKRKELSDLYFAAMLHDVGRMGTLLDAQAEDTTHPLRGANLVASSPLLAVASDGIRTHHEHWNGSGFPVGLRKDEIPLLGRIVAVADTFDLLSSERGQALPTQAVEKEMEQRSGRELDPELVTIFVNILRQGRSTQDLGRLEEQDLPF